MLEEADNFRGVWLNRELCKAKDLSSSEKLLLARIDALDSDTDKGCWASARRLGESIGLQEGTVRNLIGSLKKRKWLVELWTDGKNRGLRVPSRSKCHDKVTHIRHENEGYAPRTNAGTVTKPCDDVSRNREHSNRIRKEDNRLAEVSGGTSANAEESEARLSEYDLETCRLYTQHMKATGTGIKKSVESYASWMCRTGKKDAEIAEWLQSKKPPPWRLAIMSCELCDENGYVTRPNNQGVTICTHGKELPFSQFEATKYENSRRQKIC